MPSKMANQSSFSCISRQNSIFVLCMSKSITPYKDSSASKKEQVTNMFDSISGGYDNLNRVISFGADLAWRAKVVRLIQEKKPEKILDVATGTADLALNLVKTGAKEIVGLDISSGMLAVGQQKIEAKKQTGTIKLVRGDGEHIPFEDNYFDAITVSFGVRNFENLQQGLQEIRRVLKPNGVFVVLETSVPEKSPFKQGYKVYTQKILPLIGRLFSKDKSAYAYLSESASKFPYGTAFNQILKNVGFTSVTHKPQTFGVATIYCAKK